MFCYIIFVVYVFLLQPIPSLRLINRSFLPTVTTVNSRMRMTWNHVLHQEMTRYTKYKVSTQMGTPYIYLRTTTTAPTRTAKTCCPSASVRDDENMTQRLIPIAELCFFLFLFKNVVVEMRMMITVDNNRRLVCQDLGVQSLRSKTPHLTTPCLFSLSPSSRRPTLHSPPLLPSILLISEVHTFLSPWKPYQSSQHVFRSITVRSGKQDSRGSPPHSRLFALCIITMAMAGHAEQLL